MPTSVRVVDSFIALVDRFQDLADVSAVDFVNGGVFWWDNATGKVKGKGGTAVQVLHGGNPPSFSAIDLAADVTGILPGANGGSGNGFFAVSGPASSLKTFTFPNASATVLTSNAVVTVAQGGTGIASGTSGGILGFTASGALASSAALTANGVVIGGGAGATPTSTAAGSVKQVLVGNTGAAPSWTANPTLATLTTAGDYSGLPQALVLGGLSDPNQQLLFGYNTTSDYGAIQAIKQGTGYKNLALSPSGGNVGIGITNPSQSLQVGGNIFANTLGLGQANGGIVNARSMINIAPSSAAVSGTTQRCIEMANFVIGSDATTQVDAIYIGVTTPNSSFTTTNFYGINIGGVSKGASHTITNYASIAISGAPTATNRTNLLIGTSTIPSGTFELYSSGTGNSYFGGNVGIGATAPSSLLHLLKTSATADIYVERDSTAVGDKIGSLRFYSDAVSNAWLAGIESYIPSTATGVDQLDLRFYTTNSSPTGGVERARITPAGNVLIGGSSATGLLSVDKDTAIPFVIKKSTVSVSAPGAGYGLLRWEAGTNANTLKLVAYSGTSTTGVTIIDNVGAGN